MYAYFSLLQLIWNIVNHRECYGTMATELFCLNKLLENLR
jgi:hypothetical protein